MKIGFRKPSIKRSIKARTTGRAKRAVKKATNPLYGKKGKGFITDPERSIKSSLYHKSTTSVSSLLGGGKGRRNKQGSEGKGAAYGESTANFSTSDYGLDRWEIRYKVLISENKRKQALQPLLKIFVIKFSGVNNIPVLEAAFNGDRLKGQGLNVSVPTTNDYYVEELKKLKDICTLEIAADVYYKTKLPLNMCSKSLFVKLIKSILNDTYIDVESAYLLLNEYTDYVTNLSDGKIKIKVPAEVKNTHAGNIKFYSPKSKGKTDIVIDDQEGITTGDFKRGDAAFKLNQPQQQTGCATVIVFALLPFAYFIFKILA